MNIEAVATPAVPASFAREVLLPTGARSGFELAQRIRLLTATTPEIQQLDLNAVVVRLRRCPLVTPARREGGSR